MGKFQMQGEKSTPFLTILTMSGRFITFFFPSSREKSVFQLPFHIASYEVSSSGGFAEKEQEGEKGIRNYIKCVTFSYLPLFLSSAAGWHLLP